MFGLLETFTLHPVLDLIPSLLSHERCLGRVFELFQSRITRDSWTRRRQLARRISRCFARASLDARVTQLVLIFATNAVKSFAEQSYSSSAFATNDHQRRFKDVYGVTKTDGHLILVNTNDHARVSLIESIENGKKKLREKWLYDERIDLSFQHLVEAEKHLRAMTWTSFYERIPIFRANWSFGVFC